jgi:DNA mismatch endonuclease (patch repair protein)
MMSGIRGRDTKPEIIVRKYLHARGLRYRIAPKNLPGKPDIVLPKYRTVVFVHGCFWHRHHGCRYAATPASNRDFWQAKFKQNLARDTLVRTQLEKHGWKVLIVWECEVSLGRLQLLVDEIQSKRKS